MPILKHKRKSRIRYTSKIGEVHAEPEQLTGLAQDIVGLLLKIAVIILIMALLFTFVFGIFRMPDAGMTPAVRSGDLVIFYRLDKSYIAGDAAVLRQEGQYQVLRVAAIAGDIVDITAEGLVINGALQYEAAIYEETYPFVEGISFPVTVGENQVFLLADARENGIDSRLFGVVDVSEMSGKAALLIRRRSI